jgi:hypothetical protein
MRRNVNSCQSVQVGLSKKYDGYLVDCKYWKSDKPEKYIVDMSIALADIDNHSAIGMYFIDTQPLSGTEDTIVSNICRVVEQMERRGYFDPYIQKFKDLCNCVAIGEDVCAMMTKAISDKLIA